MNHTAYHHHDDGQVWLRIVSDDQREWDEPIAGWSLTLDLSNGYSYYTHTDGRKYQKRQ